MHAQKAEIQSKQLNFEETDKYISTRNIMSFMRAIYIFRYKSELLL